MDAAHLSNLVETAMLNDGVVDAQETQDILAIMMRNGITRSDLVAARSLLNYNIKAYNASFDPAEREGARRRWDAYYRIDRALNARADIPAQFAAGVQQTGQAVGEGAGQVIGGVANGATQIVGGVVRGTGDVLHQIFD